VGTFWSAAAQATYSNYLASTYWSATAQTAYSNYIVSLAYGSTASANTWYGLQSMSGGVKRLSGDVDINNGNLTNVARLYLLAAGSYLYASGPDGDKLYYHRNGVAIDSKIWTGEQDGSGSGLDADTVDEKHAADFATAGHNHDATYDPLGLAAAVSNWVVGAYWSAAAQTTYSNYVASTYWSATAQTAYSNYIVSLAYGTGDVSKVYVDNQDAAISNWVVGAYWSAAAQTTYSNYVASTYWSGANQTAYSNYIVSLGYGTGDVSKAYVDQQDGTLYPRNNPSNWIQHATSDGKTYGSKNGAWAEVVASGGGSATQAVGYIAGCWPQFVDTDTVIITNGDGYCYDAYFAVTNPAGISVDVTTWSTTTWGYQYYYLDYSASTFPHVLTVYAATNLPVYDTVRNGWYAYGTPQDRLLGAAMQTNATAALLPFATRPDGKIMWLFDETTTLGGVGIILLNLGNPSGVWQSPTTASSTYLPVGTTLASFMIYNSDAAGTWMNLTTYEDSLKWTPLYQNYKTEVFASWAFVSLTRWLPMGASRNILWSGEDDDDNQAKILIQGFLIAR
jgi:hypothetical protein